MKNKIKIGFWTIIIVGLCCFSSCRDMLETTSDSYLDTDDNRLNSANDSLYSVVGILNHLRQLGERYVMLGELRGDLMDVTANADLNLQAISNFDYSATENNPYLTTMEYYAVINNCNYFLQHVDTSIVSGGRKIMLGEYALVKTIRAWTYMQLGLNYGKAVYFTNPILNIADMNREYETLELQPLLERLLSEFTETDVDYLNIDYPFYGNFGRLPAAFSLIPAPVVMADLYLWLGSCTGSAAYYERAASIYYYWITKNNYRGGSLYYSGYIDSRFDDVLSTYPIMFSNPNVRETISLIPYNFSAESVELPPLITLTFPPIRTAYLYKVKPSQASIDLWNNEVYSHYNFATREVFYTMGDLRGYSQYNFSMEPAGSYGYSTADGDSLPYIAKFGYFTETTNMSSNQYIPYVHLYRAGTLYLHYAEALNALGKPSLAFAVLKHGLKREVLIDPAKITPDEVSPLPGYCNFMDSRYSDGNLVTQMGIHNRGCGSPQQDTLHYVLTEKALEENAAYFGIPAALRNKQDSIDFVDVLICKELGLETAFEGNRFHDLMRFSLRRGGTGTEFLANWVGRRNPSLKTTLMNKEKWFLPEKK